MICLLVLLTVAQLPPPSRIIALGTPLDHVQGIDTDGKLLWVSEVDRKAKRGRLYEFDVENGRFIRSVDITRGDQFHPGGISADETSIWVPVAEYRPSSSTTVLRLAKKDLAVISEFAVTDHIGAVAVHGPRIYGANWDAKLIYEWPSNAVRQNPTGTRFQDMKVSGGMLVGAGLRAGMGAIEWLSIPHLQPLRRIEAGATDRDVILTHEGMAIRGRILYLLPEDGPSRLFVFELPE